MSRGGGCYSLILVTFVLSLCGLAYTAGQRQWLTSAPEANDPAGSRLAESGTDVVTAVRALSRLETVAFHMERVVAVEDRQSRLFGLVQADDKILLIAVGEVTAGVDLNDLQATAISVDPDTGRATITVPRPQVFSARIDNAQTRVYARNTDLLARRAEEIETRARQNAEHGIREAALEAGILTHAEQNAARTLSALAASFGYPEVDVVFGDPEPDLSNTRQ